MPPENCHKHRNQSRCRCRLFIIFFSPAGYPVPLSHALGYQGRGILVFCAGCVAVSLQFPMFSWISPVNCCREAVPRTYKPLSASCETAETTLVERMHGAGSMPLLPHSARWILPYSARQMDSSG